MSTLNRQVEDALNAQMAAEFMSSFLYLSLAAYYHSLNLDGFAEYMRAQAEDERTHAMMLYDLIDKRGGRIRVGSVEAPTTQWTSPAAGIDDVLKWETQNTQRINGVIRLAHEQNDFATAMSLQPLITEQVQDEAVAYELVEKMRLLENAPGGLFMMDRELRFRAGKTN